MCKPVRDRHKIKKSVAWEKKYYGITKRIQTKAQGASAQTL